ncbi:MAG: hypothetical protein U9N57_11325 [Pseudomonadota bacterium]|nr:hypothetical protein [Pseudomonadota bacterium]
MIKLSQRIVKPFLSVVFSGLFILPGLVSSAESEVAQDYHMSIYKDVQGSTDAIELFTKAEDKGVFFGVTCSLQSAMPLIQVILFDDEIMSETPKLLSIKLEIDGKALPAELQGIINVVDNTEELSNKIRLEIVTKRGGSFQALQEAYKAMLITMQQGEALKVILSHRTLEAKEITFSLKGLKQLLQPNKAVCY